MYRPLIIRHQFISLFVNRRLRIFSFKPRSALQGGVLCFSARLVIHVFYPRHLHISFWADMDEPTIRAHFKVGRQR